jgi:ABC-type antimicrobial peptide transport system permease subunit
LLQERLLAGLGASFGCLALTLAAIGLFGLLSFFVTTRTSEIGLRIALGAERWHICRMVISEACILVATGILIGLPF